jgi:class 3 adenylate cyclase
MRKGIAGFVFTHGKPYLAIDASSDKQFFKGIDMVSSYSTKDLLCLPIKNGSNVIGVLQLLNKSTGAFDQQDLSLMQPFAERLCPLVAKFTEDESNFGILGFTQTEQMKDGTILFCDLTASSLLLDCMNFDAAIDRMNEYLERSCDIALRRGGTVDKILGDGAMIRFNIPRSLPDSRLLAVQTALEMRDSFARQKAGWVSSGIPVGALYTRIGIASGPVRRAILGHPQFQSLTVVGEPVILASNLCSGAPRDRNVILATAETIRGLEQNVTSKPIPSPLLKKIKGQQTHVVEIMSCSTDGPGSGISTY